jgi:glutamine amidotransferase
MPQPDVAVIDYGVGNLLSVRRGLEACGATVEVSSDPEVIASSPRVVLPGVGAFADGMRELCARGLDGTVKEVAARGTPLFAICLGMQMLLDESLEFGRTSGLGLIPGRVISVPAVNAEGAPQKIPHIGWSSLEFAGQKGGWQDTPLQDLCPGDPVYFVHSFMADPIDHADRLADCNYGGVRVSAAIRRNNVFGCQFHPEKSGEVGLTVLRRFLKL